MRTCSKSYCNELDTLICENRSGSYLDMREQRKRSKSDVDSHHSRDFERVLRIVEIKGMLKINKISSEECFNKKFSDNFSFK